MKTFVLRFVWWIMSVSSGLEHQKCCSKLRSSSSADSPFDTKKLLLQSPSCRPRASPRLPCVRMAVRPGAAWPYRCTALSRPTHESVCVDGHGSDTVHTCEFSTCDRSECHCMSCWVVVRLDLHDNEECNISIGVVHHSSTPPKTFSSFLSWSS